MSDLDRFELFSYVAQAQSITAAAKRLGLTKAHVSKQIKRLEVDLKVDLFSRHKQRLHLTAEGELLLTQCRRLQKELDDARTICQQFHDEPEGILRVTVFEFFGERLIFPRLDEFMERYPKLTLFIDTGERIPHFEQEQVDIAVGFTIPAPQNIVRRKMTKTHFVLCASPSYLKKHGTPTSLAELTTHRFLAHSSRAADSIIILKAGYQLTINPYISLNRVTALVACALEGIGLIQMPHYIVEDLIAEKKLVEVLPSYQADNITTYFYYPKHRYVQPKVRKFIDFFLTDKNTRF